METSTYDLSGKTLTIAPIGGFAKGMFNVISCGTMSFTFMVDIQGDKMQFNNMKVFGFAPISPCPLIPYCGFGPFANVPKFEKDPSTGKWVGTGESLCAGGCCVPMFHNKGDVIVITDANDGSSAEKPIQFLSGSSPSYPPCLWNMHVADAYVVALGGAPDAAVMLMER